ncbi:MAG TPA: phenylalanine--tRNA ligase subunit beta [Candidatus Limnocylindrales bacterium]|nr:phenylalanine--tRNA ligase subunit beta [Candidatus Limnocylindrales bacterium]
MRVPLSWLREYVDFDLTPRELAEELTMRGMEVSDVEQDAAWTDVVVGRVLQVDRHPNADTLWLTRVDVGAAGGELEIVCGAQNLEVGQLVPAALVGAVLPGDRRIERSKIRGVVSNGMLCSPIELGLGTDADGIKILGHGDEIALGTPLAELAGETVLDVDVKPNRGDALSMVGLAREIAALTGAELRLPEATVSETDDDASANVSVSIEEPELNPRFTARWFGGVTNGDSPDWMQRRLVAAGMRPISAIVDVTNYVMHELGQPMHAYDADAVPGGRIVVRRAGDGERLVTIDHVERRLDERMLVIADEQHAIGLAGIMGGASTEVSAATTSVILESAIFHGPTIRNTARRLGLRSEASMRHEKGIGHDLPPFALDRAAHLIAEITGAGVARGIVDNDPEPRQRQRVALSVDRISRLLGVELTPARVAELLRPLDFEVAGDGDALEVAVPPHRLDVSTDADLAEEVARAHGYERIPGRLPRAELPPLRADPSEPRHEVRRILAGMGLDEMVSHALIGRSDLERTRYGADGPELVRVFNPLSEDHAILRPNLYPSLLAGVAENARWRQADVRLFDVGKVYWYHPGTPTPRERRAETAGTSRYESWELGIVLAGDATPAFAGEPARSVDIADLKGVIDALHDALGAPRPAYHAEEADARHPHRHPGRTGLVCDASGRAYGSLGEAHPQVAQAWGMAGRPVDASIDLDRLLDLVPAERRSRPIPSAQPIDRDLAVVVDEATPIGELLRVARMSAGPLLADVRLFDVYRGEQIGPGRVSYAIALRFQPDGPGDVKGVEKALNKVRGSLRHHLGAEIR